MKQLHTLILVLAAVSQWAVGATGVHSIRGVVQANGAPIAGATVRLQTTSIFTASDVNGLFELPVPDTCGPHRITAWAPGFYIGGGHPVAHANVPLVIDLKPHESADERRYEWISATSSEGTSQACENCHSHADESTGPLPFEQWQLDAHSRSAVNHRFVTMYSGTDVAGRRSPTTGHALSRDYGRFPLPPKDVESYRGPGYRLDFPDTRGSCAACHAPAAAVHAPYGTDPLSSDGMAREGVTCDVCHKVLDVVLDPATGTPFANRPGVMSMVFGRPGEDHQLFAGPYDDVAPGEDVYSPLYRESRYCAPCHFGVFWDTLVYNSFGEWLASPFADPGYDGAQTCQECHMPRGGAKFCAHPEKGGLSRDASTVATHLMLGAGDEALLRGAAALELRAERRGEHIDVWLQITNDLTGHHLPTGSPLRQVLLVVEAEDINGNRMVMQEGPQLPEWTGNLAGVPGRAYAKILEELWTGVWPSGAYWNPTRIRSDTRLPALARDQSHYRFIAPEGTPVHVEARLLFRRAYSELSRQKGWNDEDIVMRQLVERLD